MENLAPRGAAPGLLYWLPLEDDMESRNAAHPLPALTPFDGATMIQALDERGNGLRVVFFKPESSPDRFGHVVATVLNGGGAGEAVAPQLVSREGTGGDGWPLSPPLQSLAIERRGAGAVALLVGMSGQSHWSASFEALANRRLVIDMACRLGTGGTEWRLGSGYLADAAVAMSSGRLGLGMGPEAKILMEFGPEMEARVDSGGVVLAVRRTTARPIRWKYELTCCG